jgi:signal transduction histidine kinase/ActR/RegA family two-component response regulator
MRLFANLSIKRKQMFIIMLTSSVALLLACLGFMGYELTTFRQEMRHHLADLALRIAEQNSGALEFNSSDDAKTNLFKVLKDDPNVVFAEIYTKNEKPFAPYQRVDQSERFTAPPFEGEGSRFQGDRLVMFKRVELNNGTVVPVFLESDLQAMYARLSRYALIIGGVMVVSFLAAFGLSSMLQRVVSEPILHLAEKTKIVSNEKNYSVRAKKYGDDELGVLIDGFNEMLGQIQARDAALQNAHGELEKRVAERTAELQTEVAERTRAEKALQQQFARISLLNKIANAISERQDLSSIAHAVIRQLKDNLPIDFGCVLMLETEKEFVITAASELPAHSVRPPVNLTENSRLALEEANLTECIRGSTVYQGDTTRVASPLFRTLAGLGLNSAVVIPLIVENKALGVLLTARTAQNGFSSGECEFLRVLGEQQALAAHQAQLHTQLQKAYDELRQTQQAVMQQERLRALGKMASGIAHDINNALSPIVVYAELLLRVETGLSDHARKNLSHIKTAGEDIAHIVSRMREFYRKREESEELLPIHINHLAQQVIDLTRPRWKDIPQERGIVIEMQTDFGAQIPEILGNGSELREAVTNLILNAVDAIPAGGKITVRTRASTVSHERKPLHVVLEVSDNGIGMDEETRSRCLEPFFSTKGQRGTGLGLAMVYGVMERHEGKIEIESELGKGTTMRLIFPVPKVSSTGLPRRVEGVVPLSSLHILCIDDEPLLRELLKEILANDGHDVAVADGGQIGIDTFRQALHTGKPFDIVITDLGMPYIDGRQVATTLKNESPQTPIVMLTGWGSMMKADGDLPTQVDAVLSKPPRINELRETLNRLTQQPAT